MNIPEHFSKFSKYIANSSGHSSSFVIACSIVLIWGITGPLYSFSNTWQLAINSFTTIVTFLMVFLIQNTQNRENVALQIKLDELIRAHDGAHNILLDLEELTQEQLDSIREKYEILARKARIELAKGGIDTTTSDV